MNNSKAQDNGARLIFGNATLCSQLLRDYSGLEILKGVRAEDIEDVTERFLPMFTEERDADVANPDNQHYGTPGGNTTKDRVFLLSADEVISHNSFNSWYEEYQRGYSMDLIIPLTAYAKPRVYSNVIDEDRYNGTNFEAWGSLISENYSRDCIGREGALWWLRSPGSSSGSACTVHYFGYAGWSWSYRVDNDFGGVRPALYITE